jgi:hypothetical protein
MLNLAESAAPAASLDGILAARTLRNRRREVVITTKPQAAPSRSYLTRKNWTHNGKWVPLKGKAPAPVDDVEDILDMSGPNPWEMPNAAWRAHTLGTAGYRKLIARALDIMDIEEVPNFRRDAEFATVLITRLQPRHSWRLFDHGSAKERREAREFICTCGESALQVIASQPI